jgi:hypothetical protein
MIEGTLKIGDRSMPITNGRVRGDQVIFNAGGAEYSGRVNGKPHRWHVERHGRRQLERGQTQRQSGIISRGNISPLPSHP